MGRSTSRPTWAVAYLAVLFVVLCSTASAFVADTKIAFVSWRDGDSEIYTMSSDGASLEQLTANTGISDELWPSWSPDGSEIVFSSTRDGGDFDIYIMDAAGQTVRRLTTDTSTDWEPAWSPDGSRIAFISYRTGAGELYVINADGSGLTQVSSNPDVNDASYENFGPSWSPDGAQIAYQSIRNENSDIYVIDADTSAEYQLTTDIDWDFWPAWSPDGATIAFASWRDGDSEIYTISPDATVLTQLTVNSGYYDAKPSWSPDGAMIAFETDRDDVNVIGDSNIYIMYADGSSQTPLTFDTGRDESPAWSPVIASDVLIYVVGGTALDDTGAPVSGLTVVVNNLSRPELETVGVTDASGVFTISLFDAFASVVSPGDVISVETYDGEFLVGTAEVTLAQTDIDGGVSTVALDIRLPVPILLNGVGFDAYPLVDFTQQAAAAAVSATPLSATDQGILAAALETTLLQLVLPGYPNTPPVLYPDFGNALVSDNLGNPMTFPRDYLVPDIGSVAGDVPRVLGAPLLNVLATTDADIAGMTMALYGASGSAEAYVLRVDSGTLVPYSFVFDSAAALNFLASWAGGIGVVGSLPTVDAVNVIVEERDEFTGAVLNTLSAPLVAIDNNTWATGDPISLTPGRVVQYVYQVTLAGDVELADGTLVSTWMLPDPYNFQWVDVADGASAIARISGIGPALGLPTEPGAFIDPTDPELAKRFAALMFRELIDSGDVGIASVFHIPQPTDGASYWLGQFDVGELQALPDGNYDLTAEAIDSVGDLAGYTLPVPLKYRRNSLGSVNLSTVSETLFSNDYFELPYAAVITGSLLSHNGYGLSANADGALLAFERVDVTPTFVVDVPLDDAGGFRVTLEEGLYQVSASAEGHETATPFDVFVSPSEPTVSPMDILLVPFLPSVSTIADQEFAEDSTLTIPLSVTTGDTAIYYVARSAAAELSLEVSGDQLTIVPSANYNTDESGPVEVIVFASDAGDGFAPLLAAGGSVQTTGTLLPDGAVVRLTNLDSGESVLAAVGTDGSFVATLGGLIAPIGVVEGAFVVADLYSDSTEGELLGTRVLRVSADDIASGSTMVDITVGRFDPTVEGVRTASFLVTIPGVNDAPTVEAISGQTTTEDTPFDVEVTVFDVDDDTTALDVTAVAVPAEAATFSYDATTSLLTVTPGPDYDSAAVVTVTASDGLLDASESFALTTTPVNDAPVIAPFDGAGFQMDEEGTLDLVVELSDVDNTVADLAVTATAEPADAVTLSFSAATSILSITGALDYSGDVTVTVTVNDGEFDVAESGILTVAAVNDAPAFGTIADQETTEDTPLTLDLPVTDVDSAVEKLTYSVTADDQTGVSALSVDAATQTLTYVPAADYTGSFSITVNAGDGELSDSVTFTMNVTAVNDAPVAEGGAVEAVEDTSTTIVLAASDADGDALTYVIDVQPTEGVLTEVTAGGDTVKYTPGPEYSGADSFTFHVSDGALDSGIVTVAIDVLPVNDPPVVSVAAGTLQATNSGIPVELTFVVTDPDTASHTLELGATSPIGGTVELTGALAVTYTPTAAFQGNDIFSVIAVEVDGDAPIASEEFEVAVTVSLPNFPPTAGPAGPFNTFVDTVTTIFLVAADPEGGDLTYTIVAPPANGALSGDGASREYAPNAGFEGQDSFIYQVTDGVNVSEPAIVQITVEPAPAPIVNDARVLEDIDALISGVPTTIDLGGGAPVFVQPDGSATTVDLSATSSAPDVAQVTLSGTVLDVLLLTEGAATITISTVTADAADSVSVSFNVTVTAPVEANDPPVVGRISSIILTEGEDVTVVPSVQDPDDDSVSFEVVLIERVSGQDGDSDPSVAYDAASGSLTVGVAEIGGLFAKYRVVLNATDGINDPVEVEFYVTAETNNEPPALSVPAALVVEPGDEVTIEVTAVDPNDGDEVDISGSLQSQDTDVRSAVRSALRSFNTADAVKDAGSFVNTLTFSVPDEINGKFFTIQWTADDGLGSANATTLITVGADVNLPPVIDPIAEIEVDEGGSVEVTVSANDPEGGVVTLTVTGLPEGATFDAASSTINWPEIPFDGSGRKVLTITATDDADQVATSSVVVTVRDVNQTPELTFVSADGGGDGVLTAIEIQETVESSFVVKGADLDGDTVKLGATGVPEWARFNLVNHASGPELTLTFEAPIGTEDFSFTLSAKDADAKVEAEVTATVAEAPNAAPEFGDLLSQTATEEELFEVTISVNDPNEDEVTLTVDPQPEGASIASVDDETFLFAWTPAIGDAGDDPLTFTFTADDGREDGTATSTLEVSVEEGENFAPVVPSPQPVSLLEDEEAVINLLVGVTDANEDPLTVAIKTGFPAARLEFVTDEASAQLTLRPEVGDAGTYTVKYTVADDRGGKTGRTLLVTVLPADGAAGAGFEIVAGYSDPAAGTIEDTYTLYAIVVNVDETAPESVVATLADGTGKTLEGVTMTATGDGDLLTGATYSAEARLGVGEYSLSVSATIGAETATFEGDGPSVTPGLIEITALAAAGSSGAISVGFNIANPNPDGAATVSLQYRASAAGAWVAATALGDLSGLNSGAQQVVWDTLADLPSAKNQPVSLRVVPATGSPKAISLRVTNVAPASPVLKAAASSPTAAVTVSGTSDTPGAKITFADADDQALGSATVGAGGTFSANLGLKQGSNRITATASLGLVSQPSAPITVIVDAIPPVLSVVSPARASTVSTLTPVISASADFGISAGNIDAAEIRLNGRAIPITYDENTGTFSGTKELVDQRVYIVTFDASKTNGLSSTTSWTFQVDLTADDVTPPQLVSVSPEGEVASAQEISAVIRDGESGIDAATVVMTLNGETVAADYLPSDDRGGTVTATLPEPLAAGAYTVEVTFADNAVVPNEASGTGTFSVVTEVAEASFGDTGTSSAPNQAGDPDGRFLAIVNTSPFTVDGGAPAGTEIAFFVNGKIVGATVADEDAAWAFDVPFQGDGEKLIQLQTRDTLGNVSPLSAPVTVLYDTTRPTIRFVTPAVTGNLRPNFTGTVTDGLSGIDPAGISILLDGADTGATLVYDAEIGSFVATPDDAFETGSSVVVRVTVADFAGNQSVFESEVKFDVRLSDAQAPVLLNPRIDGVRLIGGFTAHTRAETSTIQFGVIDDLSGVASVIGTLNGEDIAFTIADDIATLEVSGIEPDFHNVLLVRATDNQGNEGAIRLFEFERDASTDAFTLDVPSITNETDFLITGSGIESGASVTVFVNQTPTPAFVTGTTFRTSAVRLREGDNSVAATATDEVGNTADADPVNLRLDTIAPQVAFIDPVADSVVPATARTILARVTDLNGVDPDSVVLLIDEAPVNATVSVDGAVEFTAPEPFPSSETEESVRHFASITVQDFAGNTTNLGIPFFVDGVAPTIANPVPSQGEIIPTLEPQIAATIEGRDYDPDTLEVLFGIEGDALASVLDDPLFEFASTVGQLGYFPLLEDGNTYRVIVRIRDHAGNQGELTWTFDVATEQEDDTDPAITVLFPQPGQNIDDTGLDMLSFSVGDAAGIDAAGVYLFVNDPTGATPLALGRLEDEGVANYNRRTGVITIRGSRLWAPSQGARGGFSFDPLELNALERSLTGGDNASFDPLELNALERSLSGGEASFDPLELNALERSLGGGDASGGAAASLERSLTTSAGLLGTGNNTIGIQVADLSGNVSFATWDFSVSLDPPAAPTFDTTTAKSNTGTVRVAGRVPGLDGGGTLPILVSLSTNGVSSGITTVTDATGVFVFEGVQITPGDNALTATAQDDAGNLSDRSETLTVVQDIVAPTVQLDPIASTISHASFFMSGSVSDNLAGDLESLTLVINDAETALPTRQGVFSQTVTVGGGTSTILVRAVDEAGNTGVSPTFTVSFDSDPPTTAPSSLSTSATPDSRGLLLTWTADPNAGAYNVYRSSTPFEDASALTAIASAVAGTSYADTTVFQGQTFYYAVSSADAAGNTDASILSPTINAALIGGRGGSASLTDGTRLAVTSVGLFANSLLTGAVEIGKPEGITALDNGIDGTAREVTVRTATRQVLTSFNRPATLTIPVAPDTEFTADSPTIYHLVGLTWEEVPTTRAAATRSVSAGVSTSGTFQVAEAAPEPEIPAWDVDGDGTVNIVDLVSVARLFGQSAPAGNRADTNGDGVVNIIDVVTVATHFGEQTSLSAPALVRPASVRAALSLQILPTEKDTGLTEVQVRASTAVELAGYEFRVSAKSGAFKLDHAVSGDVFGENAFWMDPLVNSDGVHMAAVRLDLADSATEATTTGVLARLFVRVDDVDTLTEALRLTDVRLSDRAGSLFGYRFGRPTIIRPSYDTSLLPNYPNPFNPETWIPFSLSADSDVSVLLYNVDGTVVRTINLGKIKAGDYTAKSDAAYWDGRNDTGERVASGVYFYRLVAGSYSATRRLVIMK